MYYSVVRGEQRCQLRAFVEVNRATMSGERLAVKLIEYARLHQYEAQPVGWRRRAAAEPGWMRWYPFLPRVLFVLTGASRARLRAGSATCRRDGRPASARRRSRPRGAAGSRRPRRPRTARPSP